MLKKTKSQRGFTLIELLIVIAVIAIIAAVAFVALDPLTRFQDARDSTRWTDVTAVLDAIKVNQVDNVGGYATTVDGLTNGTYYEIGSCAAAAASCTAQPTAADCADLSVGAINIVTLGYLPSIPTDPSGGSAVNTGYYIMKAATGLVEIGACAPEGGSAISISR